MKSRVQDQEEDQRGPGERLYVFLVPAYPGSPGQKPLNGCVCVCVCSAHVDSSTQWTAQIFTPGTFPLPLVQVRVGTAGRCPPLWFSGDVSGKAGKCPARVTYRRHYDFISIIKYKVQSGLIPTDSKPVGTAWL